MQLELFCKHTVIGTGHRMFGNPNPSGNWTKQKVTLFADGSDEYTYRDPSWGKVTVRTWPEGGKKMKWTA